MDAILWHVLAGSLFDLVFNAVSDFNKVKPHTAEATGICLR
jgi:hypothetical protein